MKHLITSFLLLFTPLTWAQKSQITNAKLNAVTVYFSSAELAHSLSANLNKGTNEIVIKNIANDIDENTIRILAPKSVTVLSAQFTTDTYTDKDNLHPKSKQIKDSIELLTLQIDKLSNQIAAEKQIVELIKENKKVLGNGTALNIAEYTKFINYSKEEMVASLDKADVSKEKTLSKGKIVLQVMSDTPQKADFSLSYVTPLAGWFPFYELRANDINSPLSLLYKGEIYQTTGVDWKNIKLTLSSGNPNVRNEITLLKAWFLRFGNRYSAETMEINAYRRSNTFAAAEMRVADVKDVAKEEMVEATMNDYTDVSENQLNTSFEITTPYDILSNGREYSVALKELKIKAKYEYYSAPRVDNGVYLVASIDDYSQYNLLNGEANIIFEDMYVGKTMISPNQTTESMQLTMGNDKKISIKREKIADKSETKFISSYKEQTFTYEITIKNNKKETINLKLKDQYPISTNEKIQVELLEDSKAEVNTETGILTWNTTLKAGESKKYRLSYKVKYPKSEVIENL